VGRGALGEVRGARCVGRWVWFAGRVALGVDRDQRSGALELGYYRGTTVPVISLPFPP